jgi:glycosyl transferase family 87
MINNPALYHLTYFPFMFLVTAPFVWFFDHFAFVWDQRYLYLPAYVGTLALVPFLVKGAAPRLAMVAAIALNPQLFPFVVEGRNDFFVLLFLFAGLVLLMRERRTMSSLAFAAAAATKLHALVLLPFVAVYLVATKRPRNLREAAAALVPTWPAALFLLATFVPFLANNFGAFYDDVVSYNAGGAAWTYPISGMGFSAILLALGLIPYPQADFPFAAIEIAVAAPIAAWWFIRLWQRPSIATLLAGYALTLLAFLFFGRYFQGNYLGFIAAVFTPVPFLAVSQQRKVRRSRGVAAARGSLRPARTAANAAPVGRVTPAALRDAPSAPMPGPSPAPVPVALDAVAEPSPVGVGSTD